MITSAVIVAAGKGLRMGGPVPKQYMELCGIPVLARTLMAFEQSRVDEVIVICPKGDITYVLKSMIANFGIRKVSKVLEGGKERFDSCRTGIEATSPDTSCILVHDGARPLISAELINRVTECAIRYRACCPGVIPKDTIRLVDPSSFSSDTPARDQCRLIQTPQGFEAGLLREAYRKFFAGTESERAAMGITDDAMLVQKETGQKIYICDGEPANLKITSPEDIAVAEYILNNIA
ncbi:MAG: 2-C-methyl-D-erythritol 4-phosphate cytidylyltransferase [Lachnospiraceae bacterium]|nr:2-C-methyl-D-erythritol 4-phosphate cytidylyltransferase [Lachnospiraceae bacterium]